MPSPNLFLKDFDDREDTPPRLLVVSALKVAFSYPNPTIAFHVSTGLSSTPNIGSLSYAGYIHIITETFKQLLARLDMIQETQENIQHTQQQIVQRVDDLTMIVQ